MKRLSLIAAVVALVALAVSPAQAAPQELKFGHVGSPGSLFDLSAQHFAQLANAKLGDRYKVVVYGSSQLGGDKELLEKLKLGTVDFALPSTVMSSQVDLFGLFELPYLVRNRAHMKRIEKAIFWPDLAPAAVQRGYRIIAVWENGFRQITNNVRPIYKPSDLKGLKLRVPQGKWRVKMFEAYGASPSPMRLSEVFVALQTGVMDGEENPLSQIYSSKFQEVQKYLSMTGHVYTPAYVTVGAKKFATLPPNVQKILIDAAQENQAFVYATAREQDKDLLGKLKAAGMKVNTANKDAFIAASKPIYAEFAKEVPGAQKLIDQAIALGKTH